MIAIGLKIHWWGGPALLFGVFILISFGPSLLYALVADNSSLTLFSLSVIVALIVIFILWMKFYKKVK
jgi:hypothetical protein